MKPINNNLSIILVVLVILTAFSMQANAAQSAGTVTRSFTTTVEPGGSFVVTITPGSNLPANNGYAIEETIPAGFTFSSSTAFGHTIASGKDRFFQTNSNALTYTLTAPATAGTYTFSGTFVDSDGDTGTIAGTTTVTVGVTVSPSSSQGSLSNSGGGTWQYSRDITINNPGVALSDYQILVSLSSASFPAGAKADGADVRFTNSGGAELAYWIEEWNSSAQKAKVWVNVTSSPAGTSAVRMWYGNAMAGSASNGEATFLLFDDFNDGNLNVNKWRILNPTVIEGNGYLWFGGSGGAHLVETISNYGNVAISYEALSETEEMPYVFGRANGAYQEWGSYETWIYSIACCHGTNGYLKYPNELRSMYKLNNIVKYDDAAPFESAINTWYKQELNVYNDQVLTKISTLDTTRSASLFYSATGVPAIGKIAIATWIDAGKIDNLKVRNYASPEPSILAGPVAEYHFDGDAKDSSGNGNDGTINGGAAFVDGVRGKALSFDGVDDYINIAGALRGISWKEATIEAWVKTRSNTGTYQAIVSSTEVNFIHVQLNSEGNIAVYTDTSKPYILLPILSPMPTNVWRHIAISTKSGNSKLYENGIEVGNSSDTFSYIYQPNELHIGNGYRNGRFLNGLIDEVSIYDRALSADEIKAEYDQLAPPTVTSISVSPSPANITEGSTQLFTAKDQNNNPISVIWSSSKTSVGTISSSGVFTAVTAGTTTITATSGSAIGTVSVTVTNPPSPSSGQTLLADTFENYTSGTWPSSGGWEPLYNVIADSTNNKVTNQYSREGSNSMQIYGAHSGCWGAMTQIPVALPKQFYIETSMMASGDAFTSSSCHSWAGDIHIGVGSSSGTDDMVFFRFMKDGLMHGVDGSSSFSAYNTNNWYDLKMKVNQEAGTVDYWINGTYIGQRFSQALMDKTSTYPYLFIGSGGGKGWVDNVKVYTVSSTPTTTLIPTPTPIATPPAVISAGSVIRSISTSAIQPGSNINIMLSPSPSTIFDTPGYRVIETIPQSFTFVNTSVGYTHQGSVYNFTQIGSAQITYTLRAPSIEGSYTISGTFLDELKNTGVVTGVEIIHVGINYDLDNNGRIDRSEAVQAVMDYFDGVINRQDAINVVMAYFNG